MATDYQMRDSHRSHYILLALFLTCVLDACAADPQANSSPGAGNRIEQTGVEQAFRKALGSLKGHVNLLDRNAHYRISRAADAESWHIQLKARDVPGGHLLLVVKDSGIVDLKLSQTNVDSAKWLSSAKAGEPDPDVKVRPEAAFRQGLRALEKWNKMTPDSFSAVQGRITLSRAANDQWFMDVSGYSGSPLGGWWVEIHDNGTVNIRSGL